MCQSNDWFFFIIVTCLACCFTCLVNRCALVIRYYFLSLSPFADWQVLCGNLGFTFPFHCVSFYFRALSSHPLFCFLSLSLSSHCNVSVCAPFNHSWNEGTLVSLIQVNCLLTAQKERNMMAKSEWMIDWAREERGERREMRFLFIVQWVSACRGTSVWCNLHGDLIWSAITNDTEKSSCCTGIRFFVNNSFLPTNFRVKGKAFALRHMANSGGHRSIVPLYPPSIKWPEEKENSDSHSDKWAVAT